MVLYTCKKNEQHINKESEENVREEEKKHAIEVAGEYVQLGASLEDIKDCNIKKYMKKIAANAVLINLCEVNHIIVSNICDGDFDSVQEYTGEIRANLATCLAIIGRGGDGIKDLLGVGEIDEAIKYTIYEQTEARLSNE